MLQIKLLQGAANAYTIERDARFAKWFESVLIMDEREAFELSCQIEPINAPAVNSAASGGKESRFRRRITPTTNHRQDTITFTLISIRIRNSAEFNRTNTVKSVSD
jgi:ral guanine nucleotide dissociation stimulator-like 1